MAAMECDIDQSRVSFAKTGSASHLNLHQFAKIHFAIGSAETLIVDRTVLESKSSTSVTQCSPTLMATSAFVARSAALPVPGPSHSLTAMENPSLTTLLFLPTLYNFCGEGIAMNHRITVIRPSLFIIELRFQCNPRWSDGPDVLWKFTATLSGDQTEPYPLS